MYDKDQIKLSMRHHILIPTDFSENAWSAALYALKLYAQVPCTFYFSHAWTFVNTGPRTYISPSYIDTLKNTSKAQLTEVAERAKIVSTNNEHTFETIFSEDYLTESIITAIKEHPIDMVVMGTKGATGAKELLLGSNSVTIINKVRLCPILLVPQDYEFAIPERVAFANGFKKDLGEELDVIKKLSKLHNSTIEILHVKRYGDLTEAQSEKAEVLKEQLKDYPHNFNYIPDDGNKEQLISNFIKTHNIQILTMIKYRQSFLEVLISEPVITRLGYHTIIPFMVVPFKG